MNLLLTKKDLKEIRSLMVVGKVVDLPSAKWAVDQAMLVPDLVHGLGQIASKCSSLKDARRLARLILSKLNLD
jgi:hypothetical protein